MSACAACDGPIGKRGIRGLCNPCYQRHRYHGTLETVALPQTFGRPATPGKRLNAEGYVIVKRPGHDVIAEHRLVMEELLGRPLMRGENVHHINGVRDDNRPENLEVWITPQPGGQRLADLIDYVVEHHADELRRRLA